MNQDRLFSLAIMLIESEDARKLDFQKVRNMQIHVFIFGDTNFKSIFSSLMISRGQNINDVSSI